MAYDIILLKDESHYVYIMCSLYSYYKNFSHVIFFTFVKNTLFYIHISLYICVYITHNNF